MFHVTAAGWVTLSLAPNTNGLLSLPGSTSVPSGRPRMEEAAPRRDHLGGHVFGSRRLAAEALACVAVVPRAEEQGDVDGVGGAERGPGARMVDAVEVHAGRGALRPGSRPSDTGRVNIASVAIPASSPRASGAVRGPATVRRTRPSRRPDHGQGRDARPRPGCAPVAGRAATATRRRTSPPGLWSPTMTGTTGESSGCSAVEYGRVAGIDRRKAPPRSHGTRDARAAPRGRRGRRRPGRSAARRRRSRYRRRSRASARGPSACLPRREPRRPERRGLRDDAVKQPGRVRRGEQSDRADSAPADWPASVTRPGSPPNAVMFSLTHPAPRSGRAAPSCRRASGRRAPDQGDTASPGCQAGSSKRRRRHPPPRLGASRRRCSPRVADANRRRGSRPTRGVALQRGREHVQVQAPLLDWSAAWPMRESAAGRPAGAPPAPVGRASRTPAHGPAERRRERSARPVGDPEEVEPSPPRTAADEPASSRVQRSQLRQASVGSAAGGRRRRAGGPVTLGTSRSPGCAARRCPRSRPRQRRPA